MGDSEIDTLRAHTCVKDLGELAGRQVRPAYARFAQAHLIGLASYRYVVKAAGRCTALAVVCDHRSDADHGHAVLVFDAADRLDLSAGRGANQ
jgi:hypothetical protein